MTDEKSMLERLCRAACAEVERQYPTELSDQWIEEAWGNYTPTVKAILAELQTPTDEVLTAGAEKLDIVWGYHDPDGHMAKDMMEEALKALLHRIVQ